MPLSSMLIESGKIRRTSYGTEVEDIYAVWTDDPVVAFYFAPAHGTPHPILDLCLLESVEVEPQAAKTIWCKVRLIYAEPEIGFDPTLEEWNFDLTSQTTKITSVPDESYIQHYPETEDIGLAIGFDGVDKVEGCDVFRGQTTARCVRLWEFLMPDGFEAIESMRNTLNSDYFIGFAPGECLFLGAQISQQPDGLIRIEYNFAFRRNPGAQTVTLIDGAGEYFTVDVIMNSPWDHMWFNYQDVAGEDSEGNPMTTKAIKSVHLAQVYDYSDHNALGLIGPW